MIGETRSGLRLAGFGAQLAVGYALHQQRDVVTHSAASKILVHLAENVTYAVRRHASESPHQPICCLFDGSVFTDLRHTDE
jgi:hypothetical protein